MLRCLLFLILSSLGCQHSRPRAELKDFAPADLGIDILLTKLAASDDFLVTYRFAQPVTRVTFVGQTAPDTQQHWSLQPGQGNLALMLNGEGQFMIEDANHDNSQVFSSVKVKITIDRPMWRDYNAGFPVFVPFEDGGVAAFSQGFRIAAIAPPIAGNWRIDDGSRAKFSFSAENAATKVFVGGRSFSSGMSWRESPLTFAQGTYIYFGPEDAVSSAGVPVILDGALPDSVKALVKDAAPRLINHYASKMGAFPNPPMLVAAQFASARNDNGASGHARPEACVVNIFGTENATQPYSDSGHAFGILVVLAHEIAHYWNAVRFMDNEDSAWTWEGGAVALTYKALKDTGYFNQQALSAYDQTYGRETCKSLLGSQSYATASGNELLPYSCGFVFFDVMDKLIIKKTNGAKDLYSLWKAVGEFALARDDKNYSPEVIIGLIENLTGANDTEMALINSFFTTPGNQLSTWELQVLQ